MNLTPIIDPDTHNALVGFYKETRPFYSVTQIFLQANLLRLIPTSLENVLTLSRMGTSFFFFLATLLLAYSISRKNFLFVLSMLCLWFLNIKNGELWLIMISHSIWYCAHNYLVFAFLLLLLDRMKFSWGNLLFFSFVFAFGCFNRISIFLPVFYITILYAFFSENKYNYIKLAVVEFFIFVLFLFRYAASRSSAFSRKSLDEFVYPRSYFYDPDNLLASLFDFLTKRIAVFFGEIALPLNILVLATLLLLFLVKDRKARIYCLGFWGLFVSYFFLSVLGKFVFMKFRYNFELALLAFSFVTRVVLVDPYFSKLKYHFFALVMGVTSLTMAMNPISISSRYQMDKKNFEGIRSLVQKTPKGSVLGSNDGVNFFKTYFPGYEIINIGYHYASQKKYRKLKVKSISPNFFEARKFGFMSVKCKFLGKTDSNLKKCRKGNYLDYKFIFKNYKVIGESCYQNLCFALFKKKDVF